MGISVTHGGAPDGQELPGLIEKAAGNGIEVTEVIGDMAYVSDDNLEACGKEISLMRGQIGLWQQLQTGTWMKDSVIIRMPECHNALPGNWRCG
ncbi:hypothetical protein [Parablautia muri]|uniref:hypothetical protein n=1 Tax=Parablautia muri TaxID=2320879 RepID=UPI002412C5C8|nr:hypothetical protein [Parablautia muri]